MIPYLRRDRPLSYPIERRSHNGGGGWESNPRSPTYEDGEMTTSLPRYTGGIQLDESLFRLARKLD